MAVKNGRLPPKLKQLDKLFDYFTLFGENRQNSPNAYLPYNK